MLPIEHISSSVSLREDNNPRQNRRKRKNCKVADFVLDFVNVNFGEGTFKPDPTSGGPAPINPVSGLFQNTTVVSVSFPEQALTPRPDREKAIEPPVTSKRIDPSVTSKPNNPTLTSKQIGEIYRFMSQKRPKGIIDQFSQFKIAWHHLFLGCHSVEGQEKKMIKAIADENSENRYRFTLAKDDNFDYSEFLNNKDTRRISVLVKKTIYAAKGMVPPKGILKIIKQDPAFRSPVSQESASKCLDLLSETAIELPSFRKL